MNKWWTPQRFAPLLTAVALVLFPPCPLLFAQSAVTVTTNAGDPSAGSLGWAVTTLNAAGGGSLRLANSVGGVTLTQPLASFSQTVTFLGPDLNLTGQNNGQAQLLFQQGFNQQNNLVFQNNGALGGGLDASVTASTWTIGSGVYADLFAGAGAGVSASGGVGLSGQDGGNAAVTVGSWNVGQGAALLAGSGGSVTDTNGSGDAGGAGGSAVAVGNSLAAPGFFFQVSGGSGGSAIDSGNGSNRGGSGGSASVSFQSISSGPYGNFNVAGGLGGSGVTGGAGGAATLISNSVSLTQGLSTQGGSGGGGVSLGGAGGSAFASIGSYVGLASSNLSVAGGLGGSGSSTGGDGGNAFYNGGSVSLAGPSASFRVAGGTGGNVGPTSAGPGDGGRGGDAGVSLGILSLGPGSLFQVAAGNGGSGGSGSQPSAGGRGGDLSLTLGSFSIAVSTQLNFSGGNGGGGGNDTAGGTAGDGGAGGALAVTLGNLTLGAGSNLNLSGGAGGLGGTASGGTGGTGGAGGDADLSAGAVTLASGAQLSVSGGSAGAGGSGTLDGSNGSEGQSSVTFGSLEGAGNLSMSGTSATLQVTSGSFSGSLQGTENLQKTGSGALTLSGGNFYSGGTSVLDGTLTLDTGGSLGTGIVQVASGGDLFYIHSASGGSNAVTVASGGQLIFLDSSGAGSVSVNDNGLVVFNGSSSAANSALDVAPGSILTFQGSSSAGNARINDGAQVSFINSSTGGAAALTVAFNGNLAFRDSAGAGSAQIDDNGQLTFFDSSTAGAAQVKVENSGTALFVNSAQGGTSRFTVDGLLDISGSQGVTVGTIAGNGSIQLGAENLAVGVIHSSTTFSGVIAGTGSFTKLGTDGLTLAGENTYSGGTLIAGGTLAVGVTQALGTGSVTVSGGTLDLSGAGSPLTLQIGGDYLQHGTLQLGLQGNGAAVAFDAVSVAGTGGLGGTLDLTAYNNLPALVVGQALTVLTAGTALTGMFQDVTESLGGGVRFLPVYGPNQLALESIIASFAQAGATPNQRAVGADLDAIYGKAPVYGLISQLGVLSEPSFQSAAEGISPAGLAGLYQAGFEGAMARAALVGERLSQFKAQVGGEVWMPGFAGEETPLFAANLPARKEASLSFHKEGEWSGFLSGNGGVFNVASDANAAGYKVTTYGLTGAGADMRLSKEMAAGFLVGYGHTSVALGSGGTLSGDGGRLGFYGLLASGGFTADALLEGGLDSYGTQRASYGGTATGKAQGLEFGGALEAGYEWKQNGVGVGPVASLQYTSLTINGFSEQGSRAPLTFPGQGQDSLASQLGVQGEGNWKLGGINFNPEIRLAWEHEYDNRGGAVQAGFGTGDSFTVAGPLLGQDGVVLGAGMDLGLSKNLDLSLAYRGELNRSDFTSQQFGGGLRYGF